MSITTILRSKIEKAESEGQKVAAIHSLTLIHADAVSRYMESNSPESLCVALGIPGTYKTEISKMLAASRYLKSEGFSITQNK